MGTTALIPTGEAQDSPAIRVHQGPLLLSTVGAGPSLAAHRSTFGELPDLSLRKLLYLARFNDVRGRGGAGFPFATKLEAASRGRSTVVVNLSEGEPASYKDAALALAVPHLILDGAAICARALRTRSAHIVLPGGRPAVEQSIQRALRERSARDRGLRWALHRADDRFVAGQARAVIELMHGRQNLPVTAWQPEARTGYRGRPTLLSNAETFSQVAALVAVGADEVVARGTVSEPGTRLLTVYGESAEPQVVEVSHGIPWQHVLPAAVLRRPVLVGGYHGTWAAPPILARLTVSRTEMSEHGLALGAGVVLPLDAGDCPLSRTAGITSYLAAQSAGRCGPCLNGLPALADTLWALSHGGGSTDRVAELARLVSRRGACAHPDGTVRLVQSMLWSFADEVDAHARGRCTFGEEASEAAAHGPLKEVHR